MSKTPSSVQNKPESLYREINSSGSNTAKISTVRAIAMILAHGVLRLQQRQKDLDSRTEQSVHDPVLVTKGETS